MSLTPMPRPGSEPWNPASPKAKTPPSAPDHPVAAAVGRGHDPHDVVHADADARQRAVVPGVAEGEDAAVRGHQPVAPAVTGGRHAHHRLVQVHRPGGAEEAGVAEGEDPAVAGDLPVPLVVRRGRHGDHRLVQPVGARGPVVAGAAVGVDPARRGADPVPLLGCRHHRGHGRRGGPNAGGVGGGDGDVVGRVVPQAGHREGGVGRVARRRRDHRGRACGPAPGGRGGHCVGRDRVAVGRSGWTTSTRGAPVAGLGSHPAGCPGLPAARSGWTGPTCGPVP